MTEKLIVITTFGSIHRNISEFVELHLPIETIWVKSVINGIDRAKAGDLILLLDYEPTDNKEYFSEQGELKVSYLQEICQRKNVKVLLLKDHLTDKSNFKINLVQLLEKVKAGLYHNGFGESTTVLHNFILKITYDTVILAVRDNKDTKVVCTLTEGLIIKKLLESYPIGISKSDLVKSVWSYEHHSESRTLESHISNIRKKLSLHQNFFSIKLNDEGYVVNLCK